MVRTRTILQHYKSARPRKRLGSNKMENVNHAPSQGDNPNQQEWRPSEQNSLQHQNLLTDPNHRIEFLIFQLAQQWHQDKLEIRQDLMFICQYLKNLTERQEQLWQQMHFHHDEVMTETRHSFQALSSFFLVPTDSEENTTHTFPLHENQMKQGLASPSSLSGRVLLNPDQESEIVGHHKNEAQQKVLSSGTQGISNNKSDHISANAKKMSGESLSAGQNQVMPEDGKNDHYPGRQTYRNKSRQLNGEFDGTLGVSNIPQALNELDEQLSSKRGEEHHIKPSYTISETNEGKSRKSLMKSDSKERNVKALSADEGIVQVNENTVPPRNLNEHKVQERYIDDQNVRSRQLDEQRVQGRYIDDQNVRSRQLDVQGRYIDDQNVRSRQLDEQRVQGRYINDQNVRSRQSDEQRVQGRHTDYKNVRTRQMDEQKVHGRYTDHQNVHPRQKDDQKAQGRYTDHQVVNTGQIDEQKVQGRYLDEQNVRTRQKDEQKVQGRYRNEQNVHTRHINEQNEQGKYEDGQNVHTRQVYEQNVHTRQIDKQNEQGKYVDEQNVHAKHINQHQVRVGEQSAHTSQIDKQIDKPTNENGQNSASQSLDQPENVVNTNDSKEQIILADHKPSNKNYADAVVARPSASSVLEFNASSGGVETLNMPKPFMDPPNVLETQESFEGTGFYANIISNQLSNSSQSVNSVKSGGSSNGKTYSKAMTTKQSKSKTSDSKVFTSGSKGSKQNQGRYQGKY